MSFRRQSKIAFLILALISVAPEHARAQTNAMKLISVPPKLPAAPAIANGSIARVRFGEASRDSITCNYLKNGSSYLFIFCEAAWNPVRAGQFG